MHRDQRGIAIVMAMGIVSLAAIAATATLVIQSTWFRQRELAGQYAQAQMLVPVALDWARAVIGDDGRNSSVDHYGEPWAVKVPATAISDGTFEGHLEDEQGKFNLNNLIVEGKANPDQIASFKRLLAILGLPARLAATLTDWIDADSESMPDGAEDAQYASRNPAYLSANRPLIDVNELARISGFDQGVRARLQPFVSALPHPTPVNVNTAPAEVLVAVVEGLDLDAARTLTANRGHAYFRDIAGFLDKLPASVSPSPKDLTVSSDYFMAMVRVTHGEASSTGSALLERRSLEWPVIVWRKIR